MSQKFWSLSPSPVVRHFGLNLQAFNKTKVYLNPQNLCSTSSLFLSKSPTVDLL